MALRKRRRTLKPSKRKRSASKRNRNVSKRSFRMRGRSKRYHMKPAHNKPLKQADIDTLFQGLSIKKDKREIDRELDNAFKQLTKEELIAKKKAIQKQLTLLEKKKTQLTEELVLIDFELLST